MLKKILFFCFVAILAMHSNSFADGTVDQKVRKSIDISIIKDITDFHKVNDHLVTGGLPTAEQFAKAKEAGVDVIVNVIPPLNNENQPNLSAIYDAGLVYFNVPFDTKNPVVAMEAFIATMKQIEDKNVLIHCRSNWRVSFLVDFYYQITTGKVNENAMLPDLPIKDIMEKYKTLANFITTVEDHYKVNLAR